MKQKLVIFTTNNARILVGADPADYPGALVNPDLSAVKGIAPHFWKLADGRIVPMSASEKQARLAEHAAHGVDNDAEKYRVAAAASKVEIPKRKPINLPSKAFWVGLGGAIASFIAGYCL